MGGNSSKVAPTYFTNESYNSTRNILENLAKDIKGNVSNDAKKKGISLKGYLRQAKFHHPFSEHRPNYKTPFDLDYRFHTNVWKDKAYERDPCYGRQAKNNSNLEGAVCTNSKIKGNENKISDTGACAPYRRIHLCDYNLEHIHEGNVITTDDLLGNVLVMAKSEGESIVNSNAHNGMLNVCTLLARSFADIGDIIRGKDLYLGNNESEKKKKEELQENLVNIFKKFKDRYVELKNVPIDDIREYWWALNREDVWKALTCSAPYNAHYFIKSSASDQSFSNPKCGHGDNEVLTNLDYVPQFLRWFEEWAEHFCLVRKYKLEKVKEACRGKTGGMYCSHNGCDCEKTIGKIRHFVWDHKCNKCSIECGRYENWMKDQKLEFQKQVKKYEKEINVHNSIHDSTNNNINNKYYKDFYDKLKHENYGTVDKFINLLNEGRYCKEQVEEKISLDFNSSVDETFSRSQYCQVCPDCGVVCKNGTCKEKPNDGNCGKNVNYIPPPGVNPTDINVIYSGNEQSDITQKLKDFCTDPSKDMGKNYENWQCYYKNGDDNKCQMTSLTQTDEKHRYVMTFHAFFDFWVRNLLMDTISWETDLRNCLNNTGITECDNECNKNCKCFQSWVDKKEIEWKNVKNVLGNQNKTLDNFYKKLNGLFEGYFFQVIYKFNQDETKWNKLKENLKKKIDFSKGKADGKNSEGAVELLLEYLKEKATICKDNNTNEGCASSKKLKTNPCGKNTKTGSDKVISVKQIAQYYKRKAHAQLEESGSRRALKGDASQGKYSRTGRASDFNNNLCGITQKHSNAHGNKSRNPCYGKNPERFNIGKDWSHLDKKQKSSYTDVYLPQRREHMCTSNLENLNTKNRGLSNSSIASNSLLGDVLLAAKYEANFIKKKYNHDNNPKGFMDKATICRAMKYSFADIGDIIRGRDLWERNGDMVKLETNLKKIFKNIKDKLPGDIQEKYKEDKEPYTKLREDWWEANRDQVWKAMQCPTTTKPAVIIIKCGTDTPLMDYIPQRLRWMTEWAEWYCKAQSKEYKTLEDTCSECKKKDKDCTKNTEECNKCKKACSEYKNKIKEWADQWKQMEGKYKKLYEHARVDIAANGGLNTSTAIKDNEDKPVIEFLFELYKENGGEIGNPAVARATVNGISTVDTTPTVYSTAAGYIHQEATMNCHKQTQFCEKKHGEIPSSDTEADPTYAFRDKPHDYDYALGCDQRDKLAPESKKTKKEAPATPALCDKVKTLLDQSKGGTVRINGCNPKEEPFIWKCEHSLFQNGNHGACMPPRRQKLCINDLKSLTNDSSEEELRKAFINCAAKEIHFSWKKYEDDKQKETPKYDAREELRKGKIPEDFKRQMFYTFGDYRDLCLGKDIGSHVDTKNISTNVQNILEKQNGQHRVPKLTADDWWEKNAESIWQGMLCALSYDTTKKNMDYEAQKELNSNYNYNTIKDDLADFATRPQFLRWFIEWSDEFCREQKKQLDILKEKCPDDTCTKGQESKKEPCKNACEKYQQWLKDWKENYKTQSEKYFKDKAGGKFQSTSAKDEVTASQYAYGYLNKALTKLCGNGNCKCMDGESKETTGQPDNSHNSSMPASLDEEPEEVKGRCKCPPPPDACKIVDGILNGKSATDYIEGCKERDDKTNPYSPWNCDKIKRGEEGACMPPRRQKLCVISLQYFTPKTSDGLRKAFIECAAIETHFLWKYYKTKNPEAEDELKKGTIPEKFKRQMFYTFGDYRDLCLDKNIGNDVSVVENYIKDVLTDSTKNGETQTTADDWWKKIEKEVWDGMLCALEKAAGKTGALTTKYPYTYSTVRFSDDKNAPTLEEFAKRPQFLRWMIEWGDDFCKKQSLAYKELVDGCNGYKCNGKNGKHSKKEKCRKACEAYKKLIEKWKPEWEKQSGKYDKLYQKTQNGANDSPEEEKHVVEYLSKLIKTRGTSDSNTYDSAGKYVNQKGYVSDCQQQTDFTTSTNNKHYAFEPYPYDHEDKCNCKDDTRTQEKKKEYDDVCNTVKKLIGDNNGMSGRIESCNPKTEGPYPEWKCGDKKLVTDDNVCMPPRRQKLCVSSLTQEGKIKNKEDIRTHFINCASIETHFAWHRYKNHNANADSELKTGKIPEGFKKQMYYTFADFRDIFFGTDISSCPNIKKASENIKEILKKGNEQKNETQMLDKWNNSYGPKIWHGMLCALEKAGGKGNIKSTYTYNKVTFSDDKTTTLEEFAKRPQFLRWMTEWGEDFCKKRKEKVDKLVEQCRGCDVSDSTGGGDTKTCEKDSQGCKKCTKECETYQGWLKDWKDNYNKQKDKFKIDKKNDADAKTSEHAYQYLGKKLKNITCTSATTRVNCDYKCMDQRSSTDGMPASLDEEPQEVKGKCSCKPPPKKPEVPPARPPPEPPRYVRHDYRARSERGEDGPLPLPLPPPKKTPASRGRSLKPPAQPPPPINPAGRSLPPADRTGDLSDSEEEEGEGEEETAKESATEQDGGNEENVDQEGSVPELPGPAGPQVNVCNIVSKILTKDALQDACKQKYDGKYYGWRCVNTTGSAEGEAASSNPRVRRSAPSGSKSDASGSICVPPRRRKLYVGELTKWASGNTQAAVSPPEGASPSNPRADGLREAFIQSAAIETFFLWHKYKMDKEIEKKEKEAAQGKVHELKDDNDEAQNQLKKGIIPEEFKRQMFYTLADYRDICIGVKDDDVIKALKDSGDKNIDTITNKIKQILDGDNYKPDSVSQQQPSGDKREKWWDDYAKYIWDGMLCALSYDTTNKNMYPELRKKLTTDTTYKYNDVTFKGGFNDNTTKLINFVKRPTYFRWLEEWGEEFCRKRIHKLDIIKKDCRGKEGDEKCSGDGFKCTQIVENENGTITGLDCPGCAKYCGFYKKWIEKKKEEFTEQEKAYGGQKKQNCKEGSDKAESDNGVCGTVTTCDTAGDFLERLKIRSCKKDNDSGEDNKGNGYIDFNDKEKTFGHETYCDPCAQFTVKCQKDKCRGDGTKANCSRGTITTGNFNTMGQPTEINMLVSDNGGTEFTGDLEDCNGKGIFKSIKENKWKCRNFCGYVVCKPEQGNENENKSQILLFNALLKRWVEYFFEDYNKIRKKLKPCMNSSEGSPCIKGCEQKCKKCVQQWITKKREEWEEIKKHYLKQYENTDSADSFPVKTFLEELIPQITDANDKKQIIKLSKFDNSCGCSAKPNSERNDGHKDAIDCMLNKLQQKAEKCQQDHKPSDETHQTQCQNLSPVEDEDDTLHEEIQVKAPNICPTPPKPQAEEKGGCKTDAPQPDVKEEEEEKEEETDKEDEEEEEEEEDEEDEAEEEEDEEEEAEEDDEDEAVTHTSSPSEPQPKGLPREFPSTQLKNAMLFSTILWMVGIGFAAFTYFFLKKKPKSPVDLIRVLDIHKGDYGMPTLKSKNRYIPYRSGQYQGKTYIYMEGDSSGDDDKYAFMSDTTDITSSESEYEELDINDIYVPDSPKYKTLIEVVLEPSKSDGNIPHSGDGNTLGDDMVPTTNTFTDEEWNELKDDFISQYIQSEPLDVPQYDVSTELPMNIGGNVLDVGMEEKPFITSIHDRDLYTGEEISYNINMSTNTNNDIPKYVSNNVYSGIDLINDTLSGNKHIDIYDEVLKRKENELFGTNHVKQTSIHSVAKNTYSDDAITNKINLFHKWLDRHRDMCEKNHYITRTPKATTRTLCECELYAPSNYDNDPEMKEVMDNFNRQTQQRFHEYDDRMKTTRQKCKDKCDKEIQKIILKDKIDKELTEKFATLQTDIQSDSIPTCVCEKSLADKTEKFCLNCGYGLGSVAPNIGLLGGPGIYVWKIAALATAKELAEKAGAAAGEAARIKEGINAVIAELRALGIEKFGGSALKFVFDETNYTEVLFINNIVYTEYHRSCDGPLLRASETICRKMIGKVIYKESATEEAAIESTVKAMVLETKTVADAAAETATQEVTSAAIKTNTAAVNATYSSCHTAIIASIVAILIIVLVMKKKNEEKTPIYQIIERIDMFCYIDFGRKFGTRTVFL
ncbi:hypothetical protein C923_03190 [Plasmodium falciparum UGT5.1]|uniref:Erythrocyte membrane protein 1 n=2 Tax=Plasmodium falciparum TaxID=5833 RepID=W7JX87_PLAFA|nr:hypothetical protein C923_03190 [Plasmodium falciparum UGT5.1]